MNRRKELLATLAPYDRGDGCLGIIVDHALRDDPDVTAEEVEEICREAEADATQRDA